MTTILEHPARSDFASLQEYKDAMLEYLEEYTELTIRDVERESGQAMPLEQQLALRKVAFTGATSSATAESKKRRRRRRKKGKRARMIKKGKRFLDYQMSCAECKQCVT